MTQMPPLQPYWLIARVMMTCYGQIMKYATIMQRLACCMVKGQDHAEARIRELYSDFADLAVEHIGDSRVFPRSKLH